jgi:hypothetical protein
MAMDLVAVDRIRAEYLEMPGLSLTIEQVRRLCGIDRVTCEAALRSLVETKVLSVRPDATYARVTDERIVLRRGEYLTPPPRTAKAL